LENDSVSPPNLKYDARIKIPVERMVVTSTTHIPSLEALEKESVLVGFPGLEYISSEKMRRRINQNKITELGINEAINTELLISLQPDVVVGFAVNGDNKTYNTIRKSGIPVIYNGDWTEESPLGKAEWIKFFGALLDRTGEAEEIFSNIVNSYRESRELANSADSQPVVLSGSMYKDQWYVPYGNSWQAQFISDANAEYVYKNSSGSGSRSLAFETVLSDAQNAEFWITPGQFTSYRQLEEASAHYTQFKAVQERKVYTYSSTTGETGGVIYYELAPNRPDLVLKDLISIFHPALLPEHEPVFFKPLE
jgi:iron complex transport system substrate-binding protein